MNYPRTLARMMGTAMLCIGLATVALAQSDSPPLNEEEQELQQIEGETIPLQKALSAARRRGDDPDEVKRLQKQYDNLQKRRVEILRSTWQM